MTYKDYLQALRAYSREKADIYLKAMKSRRSRRSAKLYTLLFEWDMAEEAYSFFKNQIKADRVNLDDPMPA